MELLIKWQDKDGRWNTLNPSDIGHMPVAHSCHMFKNTRIPVVVKQDDCYIVNTETLKVKYRKTGKQCFDFKTLLVTSSRLERPLMEAGFVQGNL